MMQTRTSSTMNRVSDSKPASPRDADIRLALLLTYIYSEKYEAYTAISYRVQEVTRFKLQQNEAMGSPAPQAPFKVIGATL